MFAGRDILGTHDLSMTELDVILETAERYACALENRERLRVMDGKILATLFFEPSTRTRLSFETAMLRLGGSVITVSEAGSSSAAKGESLADSIKTVDGYADVIAVRHPMKGAAQVAADAASIPVINAGDGTGQHPTQALLDVYTIKKEQGRLEGLTVAMVGDLRNGRTVHSLVHLMAMFGNRLMFVAPPGLEMPAEVTAGLRSRGVDVYETHDLEEVIPHCDVLYVTRIQRERFADQAEYERYRGSYVVDGGLLRRAKPGLTIMHPLPRVDEIATDVDMHPGAAYFRQAHNGVPVRMALLALVTGSV